MQREITNLIESMTRKRNELDAAIGALSRVRLSEATRVVAPPAPTRRTKKWTPEHRAKFLASMAARKAKANGAADGEDPMPIPESNL